MSLLVSHYFYIIFFYAKNEVRPKSCRCHAEVYRKSVLNIGRKLMSVFIEKQYYILQTNEKQDLKCNPANCNKRIYSTDFKL